MNQQFTEEIENKIQNMMNGIHTAIPGVINDYDPSSNTATVTPTGRYKVPDGEEIDFPPISDVPIIFPQSCNQKISIAFPVSAGDGCLIIFSEQELDYFQYGESSSDLHHDLTSAIAIPGLFNTSSEAIRKANKHNGLVLQNGRSFIAIEEDEIIIESRKIYTHEIPYGEGD